MNGPEHYVEAEHCIKQGCASDERGDTTDAAIWLQLAQAHATLANVAATVDLFALSGSAGEQSGADWRTAIGASPVDTEPPADAAQAAETAALWDGPLPDGAA